MPREGMELRPLRRLAAERRGEHAASASRLWPRRSRMAPWSRARSRASSASRTWPMTRRVDAQSLETAVEFIRATGVDVFAPAIGNAHGMYRGDAEARQPASDRHRRGDRDPGRTARWHRHDAGAVHRPDRSRLREGQHLDRAQDPLHAVRLRLHDRASRQVRPAVAVRGAACRGQGDGRASTSGCSAARARPGERPHLRLRRRARRHRARRPSAGVQPDVPRVRHADRVDRGGRTARSSRSPAARSAWRAS